MGSAGNLSSQDMGRQGCAGSPGDHHIDRHRCPRRDSTEERDFIRVGYGGAFDSVIGPAMRVPRPRPSFPSHSMRCMRRPRPCGLAGYSSLRFRYSRGAMIPPCDPALAAFSPWALGFVLIAIAAGIGAAMLQVENWAALFGTFYGQLLLAKIFLLLLPALLLAAWLRQRFLANVGAVGAARRVLIVEALFGLGVMALGVFSRRPFPAGMMQSTGHSPSASRPASPGGQEGGMQDVLATLVGGGVSLILAGILFVKGGAFRQTAAICASVGVALSRDAGLHRFGSGLSDDLRRDERALHRRCHHARAAGVPRQLRRLPWRDRTWRRAGGRRICRSRPPISLLRIRRIIPRATCSGGSATACRRVRCRGSAMRSRMKTSGRSSITSARCRRAIPGAMCRSG